MLAQLLPVYLTGSAFGRHAVIDLLNAYAAANPAELLLVGRIIAFGQVGMNDLALSMRPGLADASVLRSCTSGLALNRAAERCRKTLEAAQDKRAAVTPRHASRQMPSPPRPPMPPMPKPATPPSQKPRPQPAPPLRWTPSPEPSFAFMESDVAAMKRNMQAVLADVRTSLGDAKAQPSVAPGQGPPKQSPSN